MKKTHKILAEGEVTGHCHKTTARNSYVVGAGDEREMTAPSGTTITHQEHKTIELPAGDYIVEKQREIDPDTKEIQRVRD